MYAMTSRTITSKMRQELDQLKSGESFRSLPPIHLGHDLYLQYKGQKLLNLASNNYLGLAGTESMKTAAALAARNYGTSSCASRLISGNYSLYDELEQTLCRFKSTQAALVIGSGYSANLGILSSLANRKTLIFSDRLNHASIIDGIILSRATHVRYRHADPEHLAWMLTRNSEQSQKLLVTDTVFSMDGDRAPLAEIVRLCKQHRVFIIVDEAHGVGVLGRGRGLAAELGLEKEIDLHMGTFSKALGSFGGYVAGSRELIELLMNRARSFIYSTSLPPAVVGASLEALKLVDMEPQKGSELMYMSQKLNSFLRSLGFDTGNSSTQIIPVILKDSRTVLAAREKLMDLGVYAGAIRPPTVPAGTARLRLSLRWDMKKNEMDLIKKAFIQLARS